MTTRFYTLQDWLAWQEALHPSVIDLGLDRIRAVAIRLWGADFLQQQPLTITVGGTNGKGSCVTTLAALLHSMGRRVGSFTSPHLLRYNERIRIDTQAVSDAELCEAFAAIDKARDEISLTYFEFNALAAFWLFRKHDVDVQVLEVGLGGRLDAANLLDADIAVITNIALDHVDWLGDTREKIGVEKAGILRMGGKLVYGEADMPETIHAVCRDLQVDVRQADKDFSFVSDAGGFHWQGLNQQKQPLNIISAAPRLPLPSVACALQVLAWLDCCDVEKTAQILPSLSLAGRMEKRVYGNREWMLDVAHNEAGAAFLCAQLQHQGIQKVDLLFSAMADKDIVGVLRALRPVVSRCYLFPLVGNTRAASLLQLQASAQQAGFSEADVVGCADVESAICQTRQGVAGVPVLVCGSFFTISAVQNEFCL